MSIREELLNATGITPKKKEEPQALYHRLVDAVQELEDENWEALSEEAQGWVNKGASRIEAEGEDATIAGFPDEDEPDNDEETNDDANDEPEEQEESVTEAKTSKKTSAKKVAPKKEAAPKEPKERKSAAPKATGIKVQIKKMVLKKPSMSVDELMEKLGQGGTKPSKLTVMAIRSEFRHSLFVLRDAGALSDSVKLD